MSIKIKVAYGGRVVNSLSSGSNYKLRQQIIESITTSPEMRKEVRRVFQIANRRIQNLRSHDELFSPALKALGEIGDGYSVFSISSFSSWVDIKKAYSRATAFIQQPTSTVQGSREYTEALSDAAGLSKEQMQIFINSYNGKLSSIELDRVQSLLMGYNDITSNFYDNIFDASSQLEHDSIKIENQIQSELEKAGDAIIGTLETIFGNGLEF